MRKLIVVSMVTLDGVIQGPGGPNEDTSGGFKYGGWIVPYFDEVSSKIVNEQFSRSFDLLLGRKTYDIWATYWPHHEFGDDNIIGHSINQATKYVVSHQQMDLTWQNSVLLQENIVDAIRELKDLEGPEIQVHGSANLIQTLLKHDLVDELQLKIVPITLGKGKRLFEDGILPLAFSLQSSMISPNGVIYVTYKRAGEVKTGVF